MYDVAYTAAETTAYDEVSKQLEVISRELKVLKAEREQLRKLAALTHEVQLLKARREHEAHRDWAYQPNLPSERVYTGPEEVSTWQGYQPYWNQDPGYTWNQDQTQGLEPYWQNNQEAIWNQDQGHGYQPYWQEDPSYAWNQSYEQGFQPAQYEDPSFQYQWQGPNAAPQIEYPPPPQSYEQGFQPAQCEDLSFQYQWQGPNAAPRFEYPPPPQGPTLEESLNATTLAVHRSKAMYERIDAHCEQIMECLNELKKQRLAKESPEQATFDDQDATVDTHIVTIFERSVDFDDNDDEGLIELETSDVVADLVEPIVVENADELCYPDLTDEQDDGEENTPELEFSKPTADYFSFQHFYFIPSASYFKDCSGITIANFIVDCCFLQDVGEDCLLVGPADMREEDERIQAMEWLRLKKEFG